MRSKAWRKLWLASGDGKHFVPGEIWGVNPSYFEVIQMYRANPNTTLNNNRVLIYKRTHIGDPNAEGVFGINDCMGKVRARQFYAVIGIGGISAEPCSLGIDRRVNWVGICSHKHPSPPDFRGPYITFDRFVRPEAQGPLLEKKWPLLYEHMYNTNRRVVMSDDLPVAILKEVQSILQFAEDPGLEEIDAYAVFRRPGCRDAGSQLRGLSQAGLVACIKATHLQQSVSPSLRVVPSALCNFSS